MPATRRFGQTLVRVDDLGGHRDRIFRGEPADGRSTLDARVCVAAVPLHQNREVTGRRSAVRTHRDGQCREQYLVGACAILGAQVVEDGGGDCGRGVRSRHCRRRVGVDSATQIGFDEHPRSRPEDRTPRIQFVDVSVHRTEGSQLGRTMTPRLTGGGRECPTTARRYQVGHQDVPGHGVDSEVMHHRQHAIAAVGHANDDQTQQVSDSW